MSIVYLNKLVTPYYQEYFLLSKPEMVPSRKKKLRPSNPNKRREKIYIFNNLNTKGLSHPFSSLLPRWRPLR